MLETTPKRTSDQQTNYLQPTPGTILFGTYVSLIDRSKLRSSSSVFAAGSAAAAAAWPVRLLLLLRDVASLPQSCWRGRSERRSPNVPGASFAVTAQRSVWWRCGYTRARAYLQESNSLLDVAPLPPGVEGWRSRRIQGLLRCSDFTNTNQTGAPPVLLLIPCR